MGRFAYRYHPTMLRQVMRWAHDTPTLPSQWPFPVANMSTGAELCLRLGALGLHLNGRRLVCLDAIGGDVDDQLERGQHRRFANAIAPRSPKRFSTTRVPSCVAQAR